MAALGAILVSLFFAKFYENISQNWGSNGHFEVLNVSNCQLDQKLQQKTQILPFQGIYNFEHFFSKICDL